MESGACRACREGRHGECYHWYCGCCGGLSDGATGSSSRAVFPPRPGDREGEQGDGSRRAGMPLDKETIRP